MPRSANGRIARAPMSAREAVTAAELQPTTNRAWASGPEIANAQALRTA